MRRSAERHLPSSIDQAHKADEYIAVLQLEACSPFLDRLIAYSRA
jgi:acetylornithine deacetylase/succinyl-diaminopimelate desuccinylase-like protein